MFFIKNMKQKGANCLRFQYLFQTKKQLRILREIMLIENTGNIYIMNIIVHLLPMK